MNTKASKSHKDFTQGPIARQMWALAWPTMLSMFFNTLYNIVDAYWVSKISADAIAAVSISQIALFLMFAVGFGITVGSGVLMSMDIGAKNFEGARRILGQSFVLITIAGLFFTVVAVLFADQLLTVAGATGAIFEPAKQYFSVTSYAAVLFFIMIAVMFAFNAQGDTFTLTKLFAISTLLNIIGDPILIFGWFGAPELGITGAAISTVFSQIVFITLALYTLSRPTRFIQLQAKNIRMEWQSVKKVLAIGIPSALTQIISPIGLAALTYLAGSVYKESGSVALSLGFRIEFFAYLPAIGFGFAGMAMMGQCIGAKNISRAREVLQTALKFGVSTALLFTVIAYTFAPQIVAIFTTEPVVTKYALGYFKIVTLSYAFLAATMVVSSAFQAVGKSWPGFWISLLRLLGVSVPIAYIGAKVMQYPITTIWLAMVIGNITAAVVGYAWINRTLNRYNLKVVTDLTHD